MDKFYMYELEYAQENETHKNSLGLCDRNRSPNTDLNNWSRAKLTKEI